MLMNLAIMLIFFSKRASGMLINDMLMEKHVLLLLVSNNKQCYSSQANTVKL